MALDLPSWLQWASISVVGQRFPKDDEEQLKLRADYLFRFAQECQIALDSRDVNQAVEALDGKLPEQLLKSWEKVAGSPQSQLAMLVRETYRWEQVTRDQALNVDNTKLEILMAVVWYAAQVIAIIAAAITIFRFKQGNVKLLEKFSQNWVTALLEKYFLRSAKLMWPAMMGKEIAGESLQEGLGEFARQVIQGWGDGTRDRVGVDGVNYQLGIDGKRVLDSFFWGGIGGALGGAVQGIVQHLTIHLLKKRTSHAGGFGPLGELFHSAWRRPLVLAQALDGAVTQAVVNTALPMMQGQPFKWENLYLGFISGAFTGGTIHAGVQYGIMAQLQKPDVQGRPAEGGGVPPKPLKDALEIREVLPDLPEKPSNRAVLEAIASHPEWSKVARPESHEVEPHDLVPRGQHATDPSVDLVTRDAPVLGKASTESNVVSVPGGRALDEESAPLVRHEKRPVGQHPTGERVVRVAAGAHGPLERPNSAPGLPADAAPPALTHAADEHAVFPRPAAGNSEPAAGREFVGALGAPGSRVHRKQDRDGIPRFGKQRRHPAVADERAAEKAIRDSQGEPFHDGLTADQWMDQVVDLVQLYVKGENAKSWLMWLYGRKSGRGGLRQIAEEHERRIKSAGEHPLTSAEFVQRLALLTHKELNDRGESWSQTGLLWAEIRMLKDHVDRENSAFPYHELPVEENLLPREVAGAGSTEIRSDPEVDKIRDELLELYRDDLDDPFVQQVVADFRWTHEGKYSDRDGDFNIAFRLLFRRLPILDITDREKVYDFFERLQYAKHHDLLMRVAEQHKIKDEVEGLLDKTPIHLRAIALSEFSKSFVNDPRTFQRKTLGNIVRPLPAGELVVDVFPRWSVDLDARELAQEIRYQFDGAVPEVVERALRTLVRYHEPVMRNIVEDIRDFDYYALSPKDDSQEKRFHGVDAARYRLGLRIVQEANARADERRSKEREEEEKEQQQRLKDKPEISNVDSSVVNTTQQQGKRELPGVDRFVSRGLSGAAPLEDVMHGGEGWSAGLGRIPSDVAIRQPGYDDRPRPGADDGRSSSQSSTDLGALQAKMQRAVERKDWDRAQAVLKNHGLLSDDAKFEEILAGSDVWTREYFTVVRKWSPEYAKRENRPFIGVTRAELEEVANRFSREGQSIGAIRDALDRSVIGKKLSDPEFFFAYLEYIQVIKGGDSAVEVANNIAEALREKYSLPLKFFSTSGSGKGKSVDRSVKVWQGAESQPRKLRDKYRLQKPYRECVEILADAATGKSSVQWNDFCRIYSENRLEDPNVRFDFINLVQLAHLDQKEKLRLRRWASYVFPKLNMHSESSRSGAAGMKRIVGRLTKAADDSENALFLAIEDELCKNEFELLSRSHLDNFLGSVERHSDEDLADQVELVARKLLMLPSEVPIRTRKEFFSWSGEMSGVWNDGHSSFPASGVVPDVHGSYVGATGIAADGFSGGPDFGSPGGVRRWDRDEGRRPDVEVFPGSSGPLRSNEEVSLGEMASYVKMFLRGEIRGEADWRKLREVFNPGQLGKIANIPPKLTELNISHLRNLATYLRPGFDRGSSGLKGARESVFAAVHEFSSGRHKERQAAKFDAKVIEIFRGNSILLDRANLAALVAMIRKEHGDAVADRVREIARNFLGLPHFVNMDQRGASDFGARPGVWHPPGEQAASRR